MAAKADMPFAALDMFTGLVPTYKMPSAMPDIITFATIILPPHFRSTKQMSLTRQ